MVQLECDWPAAPIGEPALLAGGLLEPGGDEAALEVPPAVSTAHDEHLRDRGRLRPRGHGAAACGVHPRGPGEAEVTLAFADAVAGVVVALHLCPVVAAPARGRSRFAEALRVIRDRGLRDAEARTDLGPRQAFSEQLR